MKTAVTGINDFHSINPCHSPSECPPSAKITDEALVKMGQFIVQTFFSETSMNLSLPRCPRVGTMLVSCQY